MKEKFIYFYNHDASYTIARQIKETEHIILGTKSSEIEAKLICDFLNHMKIK